jgi:hypothetical protein
MAVQRVRRRASTSGLGGPFSIDRRDRRPGTHFAVELDVTADHRPLPTESDPRVDEDLGTSAFGIDLLFVGR